MREMRGGEKGGTGFAPCPSDSPGQPSSMKTANCKRLDGCWGGGWEGGP